MTRIQKIALALLSALLLSVPFFRWGTGWLLLVAFVPLLLVEDQVTAARIKARNEGGGF
jgi:hypothetical protein